VQYLRLSNMQFLQNVSTSAASAGVLDIAKTHSGLWDQLDPMLTHQDRT
jgi:hypothetical protein